MRVREIEIHHVDLDVGYSPTTGRPAFAEELVDGMVKRQQPDSRTGLPGPPARRRPHLGGGRRSATTRRSSPARSPTWRGG